MAAGYADFPLIAFHFQQAAIGTQDQIPLFYALAMGVDGISALAFGRWFDRIGFTATVY